MVCRKPSKFLRGAPGGVAEHHLSGAGAAHRDEDRCPAALVPFDLGLSVGGIDRPVIPDGDGVADRVIVDLGDPVFHACPGLPDVHAEL